MSRSLGTPIESGRHSGPDPPATAAELRQEANSLLGAGAVLGGAGLASGLLLGAVCPVCIVVTPALLGMGTYKHWCARRASKRAE